MVSKCKKMWLWLCYCFWATKKIKQQQLGEKKKKKEELHSSKAGKGLSRPDQNRLGYPQHGETESTPQLCHLPTTASGYIIYLLV